MTDRATQAWEEYRAGHGFMPATWAHHEQQVFLAGYRAGRGKVRLTVVVVILLLAARRARR